jgi:hypothetical protein
MKKLILTLVLALAWATSASASTWTVRGQSGNSGSPCLILLQDAKVDANDLIAVLVTNRTEATSTVTSLTDDRSNVYSLSGRHATAGQWVEIWTAKATNGGDTNITVTMSGSPSAQCVAAGIGGAPASWHTTTTSTGNASAATSHPAGSVTAASGDLILTASSMTGGVAAPVVATGYTAFSAANSRQYLMYKNVTGAWTDTATWSSGGDAVDTTSMQAVIRDGAAPAGGGAPARQLLLGCCEW